MRLPNIVFICADQLGAKFLGCYGSGVDSTPNLDRLAERGVRFDRYYATHPICAPNRATMLTGRSASAHGIVSNNYALATDSPTYATVLREHGYRTGGFGKFHQTPMMWPVPTRLDFLGFDDAVVSEDPKWGPYIDWVRSSHPSQYDAALAMANGQAGNQAPDARTDRLQGASDEQVRRRAIAFGELMQGRIAASEWERMYASPVSAEAHDTVFVTECALEFLRRQSIGEPFVCHVSYVDPHDPYDPPEPYTALYDPVAMRDPVPAEWKAQGPECLLSVQSNYLKYERIADDPAAVRRLRANYHGQLRLLDDQIGRLIDELESAGLWENTVVVFSTDHGEHLGDHGMIAKGFAHYDAGIRCPLIVGGGAHEAAALRAGSPKRGAPLVNGRLSCTLDLFPTFCDWAGVPDRDRPPLEGRSFAGAAQGWPEVTVTMPDVASVLTDDGYRLTWYPASGEGQLFDLGADPDETRNLFELPEHAHTRIDLLQRLVSRHLSTAGTPHYRNMPIRDGEKWNTGARVGGAIPRVRLYPNPGSPWLDADADRPQWIGGMR